MAEEFKTNTVGKGRPPVETRFKRGESGSQRGHKKGQTNMRTIVHRVAYELHSVVENGERRTLPAKDLIFKRLQGRSLSGDLEAKKLLDQIRARYQPEEKKLNPGLLIPPVLEPEDWLVRAEAARQRMFWVQSNRPQLWKEMGACLRPYRIRSVNQLKSPDATALSARAGPVQRSKALPAPAGSARVPRGLCSQSRASQSRLQIPC
ncbi:MAG: DUF5681 domain-containing protein [Paracoccaceae bacterium]